MSDDVDKFLQEADMYEEKKDPNGVNAIGRDKTEEECKPMEESSTRYTQYCNNGQGYSAAGSPVPFLKPGVYSIGFVNRILTFLPEVVNTDRLIKFPDSRADKILKEIQNFWDLKEEFKNGNDKALGGYLHKRGYLVFGPPGSGKTCLLKFVIQDIIARKGVVLYGDTNPECVADGIKTIKTIEPDKQIVVLLEDFDDLIRRWGESTYLSLLDGENSMSNVLYIATTNYVSRFDPRMYNRPGRLSDVIYIGMPSAEARRLYLDTQLKEKKDIDWIVENTEDFSLDHLKSLVLGVYFEKKDLQEEVKRLRNLFKIIKDDKGNKNSIGFCKN